MKPLTLCVLCALCVMQSAALAKSLYVSASGSGAQSGADIADAHSLAWLNTAGNWGAGGSQVNPGDTVELEGTITSSLTIAGSGTLANPVTIQFDTGANFTSGCWPAAPSGAVVLNGQSNIVIDGGVNGLIQNTSNGYGLATENDSSAIAGQGNFIFVKNLCITNICVNQPGDTSRVGYPIEPSSVSSGVTISNCSVSWGDALVSYAITGTGATGSNFIVCNNRFTHFNHGINYANGTASGHNDFMTNLVFYGNTFSPGGEFIDGGNAHHNDGIIVFTQSYDPSLVTSGMFISNNIFPDSFLNGSSAIFINATGENNCAQWQNVFIHDNLFLASSNSWADGFICATGSNLWVVNNTMIGGSAGGVGVQPILNGGTCEVGGTNAYFLNNIAASSGGVVLMDNVGLNMTNNNTCLNTGYILSNACQSAWSDFNVYFAGGAFGVEVWSDNGGTSFNAIAAGFGNIGLWQTYGNSINCGGWALPLWATSHCDPHSTTNYQLLTFAAGTNWIPAAADIVANNLGTNLHGILPFGQLNVDYFGAPRPATGAWTAGYAQASTAAVLGYGPFHQ